MESCFNHSTSTNLSMESSEDRLNHGYVIGIYLTIVGLAASIGNVMVLLVFCKRNSFRSPINYLILNLCASDLALAAITNPLSAVSSFCRRWSLQDISCQLYGFTSLTCFVNATMTHAAICYYRYKIVCRREYLYNVQANSVTKVLLGIWFITLFWTITPLAGWSSYTLEPVPISCYINQQSTNLKDKTYICFYAIFVLLLPFIFIVYFYGKIARHVKEIPWTKRQTVRFPASFRPRYLMEIELRVTCVCVLMAVLFMTTWTPYVVASLMQCFGVVVPKTFYLINMLLTKMSCTYNPFVYCFTNTKFRQTLCSVIFRCYLKKITPIHLDASGIEMRKNRVSPTGICQQNNFKNRYMVKAKPLTKHHTDNKKEFPERKREKVFNISECFTKDPFTFRTQRSIIPRPPNNRKKEDSATIFTEI